MNEGSRQEAGGTLGTLPALIFQMAELVSSGMSLVLG